MKSADWIQLLNKIPVEDHDQLIVSLTNGMEICLQRVMKIEEQFVLIKGRMGGTSDVIRLMCLPYTKLVCMGFTRAVSEEHAAKIFGTLIRPAQEAESLEMIEEAPATEEAVAADETAEGEKPTGSRSVLLEKLRARAAAKPRE